jgi:hypothetical protein
LAHQLICSAQRTARWAPWERNNQKLDSTAHSTQQSMAGKKGGAEGNSKKAAGQARKAEAAAKKAAAADAEREAAESAEWQKGAKTNAKK